MKYLIIIGLVFCTLFNISAAELNPDQLLKEIDNLKNVDELNSACPADLYHEPEIEYKDFIAWCTVNQTDCLSKCIEGSANHCSSLAYTLQDGSTHEQYPELLYSAACRLGLVSACTNRAAGLLNHEIKKNQKCSVRTFRFSCDKKDSWGCTMYGYSLARGIGIKQNYDRALKVLANVCKLGPEEPACKNANALIFEVKKMIGIK